MTGDHPTPDSLILSTEELHDRLRRGCATNQRHRIAVDLLASCGLWRNKPSLRCAMWSAEHDGRPTIRVNWAQLVRALSDRRVTGTAEDIVVCTIATRIALNMPDDMDAWTVLSPRYMRHARKAAARSRAADLTDAAAGRVAVPA